MEKVLKKLLGNVYSISEKQCIDLDKDSPGKEETESETDEGSETDSASENETQADATPHQDVGRRLQNAGCEKNDVKAPVCYDCISVSNFFIHWRDLLTQEARYKERIEDLNSKLNAKESEVQKLQNDVEVLSKDIDAKTCSIDGMSLQLNSARSETAVVVEKLKQMEDDLASFKQKNAELSDELLRKSSQIVCLKGNNGEHEKTVSELQSRVKELEEKLKEMQEERDKLMKEREEIEEEREEEMRIIHEALEEALEEKEMIQEQFEKDFEDLRTENTDREQHLMDDFEWKLREIEKDYKEKLQEKNRLVEDRALGLREVIREEVKKELQTESDRLQEEKKAMEDQIRRMVTIIEADKLESSGETAAKLSDKNRITVSYLQSFEAELKQLRGLVQEQQKSLQVSSRQIEQFKLSERLLQEDLQKTRGLLDKEKSHLHALQTSHLKKQAEEEEHLKNRLGQLRSELNSMWEDKLRTECSKLKVELDQLHSEEKQLAVESMRVQKEQELQTLKQKWDKQHQDLVKEISTLKDSLTEKDTYYHIHMEKVRSDADRDVWEMRRKLMKLDDMYQDEIEKLKEEHSRQIVRLRQEYDEQLSTQKDELQKEINENKEEMQEERKELQENLEELKEQQKRQIEALQAKLEKERQEGAEEAEEKYQDQIQRAAHEVQEALKFGRDKEAQLQDEICDLNDQLDSRERHIDHLKEEMKKLKNNMQILNTEISQQGDDILRVQSEANQRIRECEAELNATMERKLSETREIQEREKQEWQRDFDSAQQQWKEKNESLNKLLEDAEEKYKKRESRPEDIHLIMELKEIITNKEEESKLLNEEKRFLQLEMLNREKSYNKLFNSNPSVGVLDPLASKKGKNPKNSPTKRNSTLMLSCVGKKSPLHITTSNSDSLFPLSPGEEFHDAVSSPVNYDLEDSSLESKAVAQTVSVQGTPSCIQVEHFKDEEVGQKPCVVDEAHPEQTEAKASPTEHFSDDEEEEDNSKRFSQEQFFSQQHSQDEVNVEQNSEDEESVEQESEDEKSVEQHTNEEDEVSVEQHSEDESSVEQYSEEEDSAEQYSEDEGSVKELSEDKPKPEQVSQMTESLADNDKSEASSEDEASSELSSEDESSEDEHRPGNTTWKGQMDSMNL